MSDFAEIEKALKAERLQDINPHYDTWVEFYALQEAIDKLPGAIEAFIKDVDTMDLRRHSGFIRSMEDLKATLERNVESISGFLNNDDDA
ncbi:MAG: hypothetical protein ACOYNP_04305 [Gemmataceae bacterium]